jgi:hypothetical protein
MRWLWRYWPWLPPGRQEVVAIVVGIFIAVAFLLAVIKYPTLGLSRPSAFGPDWDCTSVASGESVCVKRVPVNPPKSTAPFD